MSFRVPSLNSLKSFVSELCCRQTNKQADRRTQNVERSVPTLIDIVDMVIVSTSNDCAIGLFVSNLNEVGQNEGDRRTSFPKLLANPAQLLL